jgi:hypothetical protein
MRCAVFVAARLVFEVPAPVDLLFRSGHDPAYYLDRYPVFPGIE